MLRIDKVVTPLGLIASAKTYTLILESEGLYIIHTGPATSDVYAKNAIQKMAVDAVGSRYDKKIAEGEARIANTSLSTLAQEKHSAFFKPTEINSLKRDTNLSAHPLVYMQTAKKKYKFNMKNVASEAVDKLVDELKKRGVAVVE